MSNHLETIDAHQHLWRYTPEEYGWIDERMAALRRDFVTQDLGRALATAEVQGSVAVQARQTLEETRWLCALASGSALMLGVVGWAPLADDNFASVLESLRVAPKLVGLRHVVQAESPGFLDGIAWNEGVRHVTQAGLTFDLLVYERQLAETIRFVDRHPNQPFVLDHLGKPRITAAELEPWKAHLKELSRRTNVFCKLSGIVTEADWSRWTIDDLRPYLDAAVESFGPGRLMAGSDWPVCLLATTYAQWWELLRSYFAEFSADEQRSIFAGNARRFYKLPLAGSPAPGE